MTTSVSGTTVPTPGQDRRVGPVDHRDDGRPADSWGVVPHDVFADILSEAWRPGAAEPVAIHVRPELQVRLGPELCPVRHSGSVTRHSLPPAARVPLVVDDRIPTIPGYEIHRAPPPAPTEAACVHGVPGRPRPASG